MQSLTTAEIDSMLDTLPSDDAITALICRVKRARSRHIRSAILMLISVAAFWSDDLEADDRVCCAECFRNIGDHIENPSLQPV